METKIYLVIPSFEIKELHKKFLSKELIPGYQIIRYFSKAELV
jgi:hypothetical protein